MSNISFCTVKITGFGTPLKRDLKNIAGHKGISINDFMRPELSTLFTMFPAHLTESNMEKGAFDEMRLRNIHVKVQERLQLLAGNIGVSVSDLIKVAIAIRSNEIPAHLKTEWVED